MTMRRAIRAFFAIFTAFAAVIGAARADCEGTNLLDRLAPSPAELADLRAAARVYPNAEGRFWRVERAGTPPSHIFGTYHATEPEVATPPREVAAAIRASRLLYVEITPEEMGRMQAAIQSDPTRIMETTGGVLDDFLSPRQLDQARKVFAEYGLPWEAARRVKPWYLQVMLAQPPCASEAMLAGGKLLDQRLAGLAEQAGVATEGLEGWEVAIGLFENQSTADQRRGLMLSLAMAGQAENLRRTALDLYLAGEVMMIWEFGRVATRRMAGEGGTQTERMEREFWDKAVVARNQGFMNAARAELTEGGVVIAVGALHLPGEDGMIEKLRAEGYTVTRLD